MNSKGLLLTEREVCMGKYQTEVLTVRTERSEVRKKDHISHTDRASEVNNLFII